MSIQDKSDKANTQAVVFEFDLMHQPEKVWRALTDPDLLKNWLLPSVNFAAEPGTDFEFRADPVGGWDGVVNCRMLEVDRPRRLKWTWIAGGIDTTVTFELSPQPGGTRLSMVQDGFREDQKQNRGGARYGWRMMGDKLEAVLDSLEG